MPSRQNNQTTGRWGEQVAEEFLIKKGYKLVGRNIRTASGELDLVVEKDGTLVFVEVKTRTGYGFGFPEESVTDIKKEHILSAAQEFLENREEVDNDWRVDVIAINVDHKSKSEPKIEWFENAFS